MFADARVCPSCSASRTSGPRCPQCGLRFDTHEAGRLWQALQALDLAMGEAREASVRADLADRTELPNDPVGGAGPLHDADPLPHTSPVAQPASGAATTVVRRRRVSAGAVLLGIGAFCLIVAGGIFALIAWGQLGAAGRAVILAAITAGFAAGAHRSTGAGLRGSAEALWAVALGLLTFDVLAVRAEGLLGADAISAHAWGMGCAVVVMTAAVVAGRSASASMSATLVVPSLAAGTAVSTAAVVVVDWIIGFDDRGANLPAAVFVAALSGAAVALGGALVLDRLQCRVGAVVAVVASVPLQILAVGSAFAEVFEHPGARELVVGHAVPLLIVCALAVAATRRTTSTPLRSGTAAFVALAITTLVVLPLAVSPLEGRGAALGLSICALASVIAVRPDPWSAGVRWFSWVPLASTFAVFTSFVLPTVQLVVVTSGIASSARLRFDDRVSSSSAFGGVAGLQTTIWWLVLPVTTALVVACFAMPRWPSAPGGLRDAVRGAAVWVVAIALTGLVAPMSAPVVLHALLLGAVAISVAVSLQSHNVWRWTILVPVWALPWAFSTCAPVQWGLGLVTASLVLGLMIVVVRRRPQESAWPGALALVASIQLLSSTAVIDRLVTAPTWVPPGGLLVAALVISALVTLAGPRSPASPAAGSSATWLIIGTWPGLLAATAWLGSSGPTWFVGACAVTGLSTVLLVVRGSCADEAMRWTARGALMVLLASVIVFAWSIGQRLEATAGGPTAGWFDTIERLDLPWSWRDVVIAAAAVGVALVIDARRRSSVVAVEGALGTFLPPLLVVTVASVVPTIDVPFVTVAIVWLGLVLGTSAWAWTDRRGQALAVAVGLLAPVAVWSVASAGLTLALSVASVAALFALTRATSRTRAAWLGVSTGYLIGAHLAIDQIGAMASRDWGGTQTMISALVATAVIIALAVAPPVRAVRAVAYIGAVVAGGMALSAAAGEAGAMPALALSLLGIIVSAGSLVEPRAIVMRWVGAGLVAASYLVRLVGSGVDLVEAYTVPFAVAFVALAAWRVIARQGSSRLLWPGLTLGLVPSLFLVVDDPVSLRALLVGAAAVGLIAWGVVARWQAPFLAGAGSLIVVVFWNIAPHVGGAPRWVSIGAVGAILMVTGVTWEKRVQEGRAAVRWVASMR